MKKNKVTICLAAVLLAVFVIGGYITVEAESSKTIVIGDVDIFSGPIADQMASSEQGVTLARDFINSKGGITVGGEKYLIEVYQADDKMDPVAASAATTDCVARGIKFIMGSMPTFLSLATSSVTEPNEVFYVPLYNAGLPVEFKPETTKYKFYANMGTFESDAACFYFLTKNYPDVKKIAYILIDDGSIQDSDAGVREVAAQYGITIIGETIGYGFDIVDFAPIAQKAISRNPDAVFISNGIGIAEGNILKNLRTMGYDKLVFSNTPNQIEYVLDIAGQVASTNYFRPGLSVNTPDMPDITKELAEYAKANWPDRSLDYVRLMYANGLYVLVKAIEKAQSLEPKKVAAAWENWDSIDTLFGPGKIGGMETYGLKHSVYYSIPIQVLDNGNVKDAGWVDVGQIYRP